jgi:hypothetical protein
MFKSTKIETSIQRSDSAKSDSDNPWIDSGGHVSLPD